LFQIAIQLICDETAEVSWLAWWGYSVFLERINKWFWDESVFCIFILRISKEKPRWMSSPQKASYTVLL